MQNKQTQTLLTSVIPVLRRRSEWTPAGIHHLAIPPSATSLDAGFHRHDGIYLRAMPDSNCSVGKYSVFEFCIEESLTQ